LGAFAPLATATDVDRSVVAQLTEANSRLAKQLEDNATSLKEVNALLKKERSDNDCWSHGYKVARTHAIQTCMYPKEGHQREATKTNNMGGSQVNNH
jgi:hypothetical protein